MRTKLLFIIFSLMISLKLSAWEEIDGLYYNLYSKDHTAHIIYSQFHSLLSGELIIPPYVEYNGVEYEVTEIGEEAFWTGSRITSIQIPATVTKIGNAAFHGCTALKEIIFLDGEQEISLEGDSFASVYGKNYLFSSTRVEKVYLGRTLSGTYTFASCKQLETISISKFVKKIPITTFTDCTSLKEVIFEDGDEPITLGLSKYGTLFEKSPLKKIYLGRTISYKDEDSWAKDPQSYGYSPFHLKTALTSVEIGPYVTKLPNYLFCSCWSLSKIEIPNNIIEMGNNTLYLCPIDTFKINMYQIPPLEIDYDGSLKYVEFGPDVKRIEMRLYDYSNLSTIDFLAENCEICHTYDSRVLPPSLKSINFGDKVNIIPSNLFNSCTWITDIILPPSLKSIGERAFYNCSGLTSIELPPSVSTVGASAFRGCTSLNNVIIRDLGEWSKIDFEDKYANPLYNVNKLVYNNEIITELKFPSNTTSIGSYAFAGCNGITSVTVPNYVNSIGDNAFEECALTSFEIEAGETEITLGSSIVNLSNTDVYMGRHWNNSSTSTPFCRFNSFNFDHNIISIPDYAFSGAKIYNFIVPSTIKSIGANAFSGSYLKSIAIGCGLETLEENTFANCLSLADVYITAIEPSDANDNSFSNYNANLWLTPGVDIDYQYAIDCWWKFNNRKELVVPTSFEANRQELTASTGKKVRLGAIFAPEDVTLPYVFWHSSNPEAATVDSNGLVTIIDETIGCDIYATNLYAKNNLTRITINGGEAGVNDIVITMEESLGSINSNVYNMQGICVKCCATQAEVMALPTGLYIYGNKKIYVK